MPVCIAGMARSGTSLCTRMLNLCGMYLGEEADLLPPAPDNPDGFWENARLVEINEALLNLYGGAWDHPPTLPPEDDSEPFAHLRAKAEAVLETFAGHEPWGWKDPRNSLTLPFWLRYFPDMKVVICLRNPLEVAQSLYRRSWYSTELSLTLWHIYNQRLLGAIPPERRIITHYDRYFEDPEAEIRRVLDFLALPVADERLVAACAAVSGGLRHHRFTTEQMRDVGVTPAILDLYTAMCEASEGATTDPPHAANGARTAGGTAPRPARAEVDRDPAPRARDESADGPSPGGARIGLAVTGVGRLDRAAMDVILLREEVRDLNAVVDAAREERETLHARVRGLEEQLAKLSRAHERRGAYLCELEEHIETSRAADREFRSYVRDLERDLATAHAAHDARGQYIAELEALIPTKEGYIALLEAERIEQRDYGARLEALIPEKEAYIAALEGLLPPKERYIAELEAVIPQKEEYIAGLEAANAEQREYISRLEAEIVLRRDHPEGSHNVQTAVEGDTASHDVPAS